jgi:hypothetical protein
VKMTYQERSSRYGGRCPPPSWPLAPARPRFDYENDCNYPGVLIQDIITTFREDKNGIFKHIAKS